MPVAHTLGDLHHIALADDLYRLALGLIVAYAARAQYDHAAVGVPAAAGPRREDDVVGRRKVVGLVGLDHGREVHSAGEGGRVDLKAPLKSQRFRALHGSLGKRAAYEHHQSKQYAKQSFHGRCLINPS